MDPRSSKLQQKQETAEQMTQKPATREFTSVEEMLRHDAAQTDPPESVAHRLADSISREPRPSRTWWRRLFFR